MICKKHGKVGAIGFSVFDDGKPVLTQGRSELKGSFMVQGSDAEDISDEYSKECRYAKLFCVQCVGNCLNDH